MGQKASASAPSHRAQPLLPSSLVAPVSGPVAAPEEVERTRQQQYYNLLRSKDENN